MNVDLPELAKWNNFYVIVGSAAGTLTGLQFVVLTLIANKPPAGAEEPAPRSAVRRWFTSASHCFCRHFYMHRGKQSLWLHRVGVLGVSAGWRISRS